MTEQAVNHYDEYQVSFFDILVTLAESWKLLVFGPLIATALAASLIFAWPKTFESTAIVRLTEAEAALVGIAPVLDPLIVKFDLLNEFDGNQDEARAYLIKKIATKYDKRTSLTTISVTAATPERAHSMLSATIDALLIELLPKGKSKDQIEQTILSNEGIIATNSDAVELLKSQIGKLGRNDTGLEVVMKHYANLSTEVARKELENIELRKSLTVKGAEVFVQQPSLPRRYISPKNGVVIVFTLLMSSIILIAFVFIRQAWRSVKQNPESASKIIHIKHLLGFNSDM